MSEFSKILASINSLNDVTKLADKTSDGETSTLEFKSAQEIINNEQQFGHAKDLLAKEICAFLNSNGGLLCWGIEKDKASGNLIISNSNGDKLADFFDRMLDNLIEPQQNSIAYKTVTEGSNSFLVISVDQGDLVPYRVGSWKNSNKKTLHRYYIRSGTKSEELPENIIRLLYQSRARVPHISLAPKITAIDNNSIRIKTSIKPDNSIYIEKFYHSTSVALIRKDGTTTKLLKPLYNDLLVNEIYPSTMQYDLSNIYLNVDPNGIFRGIANHISITRESYANLRALLIKNEFACDKLPLRKQFQLFTLNTQNNSLLFDRKTSSIYHEIEKQYNLKIYEQCEQDDKINTCKLVDALSKIDELYEPMQ